MINFSFYKNRLLHALHRKSVIFVSIFSEICKYVVGEKKMFVNYKYVPFPVER